MLVDMLLRLKSIVYLPGDFVVKKVRVIQVTETLRKIALKVTAPCHVSNVSDVPVGNSKDHLAEKTYSIFSHMPYSFTVSVSLFISEFMLSSGF